MAVRRMILADEETTKKRVEQLNEQIKQAQETLKQAKESDPKSERVFNLETRLNNLKTQRDRLKHRADEQKENEQEESAGFRGYEIPATNPLDGCDAPIHLVNDSHGRIKDGSWDGSSAMCGKPSPEEKSGFVWEPSYRFATCTGCLRAYVAAGGKGWFLPADGMSDDVVQAIEGRLLKMRGAHFTNLHIRKDGQDFEEEGDWIRNLRQL